jgi:hypothetical protein
MRSSILGGAVQLLYDEIANCLNFSDEDQDVFHRRASKCLMLRFNRLFSRFYRLFCAITGNALEQCLTSQGLRP